MGYDTFELTCEGKEDSLSFKLHWNVSNSKRSLLLSVWSSKSEYFKRLKVWFNQGDQTDYMILCCAGINI